MKNAVAVAFYCYLFEQIEFVLSFAAQPYSLLPVELDLDDTRVVWHFVARVSSIDSAAYSQDDLTAGPVVHLKADLRDDLTAGPVAYLKDDLQDGLTVDSSAVSSANSKAYYYYREQLFCRTQ